MASDRTIGPKTPVVRSGPTVRSIRRYCSISFVHHTYDHVCTTYVVRTYVPICTYACCVLYVVAVVRVYVLQLQRGMWNAERGTRNSNSQLTQFIIIYLFWSLSPTATRNSNNHTHSSFFTLQTIQLHSFPPMNVIYHLSFAALSHSIVSHLMHRSIHR